MADRDELSGLPTEQANPLSAKIDAVSTREMLEIIHEEDRCAVAAVGEELPSVAAALEAIIPLFAAGGRLIYVGAGTSGRLGALDAAELPPTFGLDPQRAVAILAGGREAMFRSIEGAEDERAAGAKALGEQDCRSTDAVIALAASGRTPFVLGAVERARALGALTVGVTSNRDSELARTADVPIAVATGAEVVAGSTRMKSGTAQKLVLNMLSTGLMIRMGYVFGNRMVNVRPVNEKLRDRARRLVTELAAVSPEAAAAALEEAQDVRLAVLLLRENLSLNAAQKRLEAANGSMRRALERRSAELDAGTRGGRFLGRREQPMT